MRDSKNTNPVSQGRYLTAARFDNLIFTSGMTPRYNGNLIQEGKVNSAQPITYYQDAVRLAVANALTSTENKLEKDESIKQVLSLTVYFNTDRDFTTHSALADFASDYLFEKLGHIGIGSRAALGVASLPGNAPVEIQLVSAVSK